MILCDFKGDCLHQDKDSTHERCLTCIFNRESTAADKTNAPEQIQKEGVF